MIKELLTNFKNLLKAFLRDVLIFLLFFGTYSGVTAGLSGISKAKSAIQKYFVPKKTKERHKGTKIKYKVSSTV